MTANGVGMVAGVLCGRASRWRARREQGLNQGGVPSAVVHRDVDGKARRVGWGSGEAVWRRASRRRARDGLESELGDGEGEESSDTFIEREGRETTTGVFNRPSMASVHE
jgi:hypothetical protein